MIPSITPITDVPIRSQAANNTIYRQLVELFLGVELPLLTDELAAMIAAMNPVIVTMNAQTALVSGNTELVLAAKTAIENIYQALATTSMGPLNGTSVTSNAIGTGSKVFAAGAGTTGKYWWVGQSLYIGSVATPGAYMVGEVTAYDIATGALTVSITNTSPTTGTFNNWIICPAGARDGVAPKTIFAAKTDTAVTSSTTWADTGLEVTINVTRATNAVKLNAAVCGSGSDGYNALFRITRAGSPVLQGDAVGARERTHFALPPYGVNPATLFSSSGEAIDVPGATGAQTYKLQWKLAFFTSGQFVTLNSSFSDTNSSLTPRGASTLSATEISQ